MDKVIYFAGGCFWGTAHLFSLVQGVKASVAGYANSRVENPSYRMVCTGLTGASESVEVLYNPGEVSLSDLVRLYLRSIDPLSLNRQGNDVGTQYRTGIYYTDPSDVPVIEGLLDELQERYTAPLAIEFAPLENFYPAEEYHQDYLVKNPAGYCHVNPELFVEARKL